MASEQIVDEQNMDEPTRTAPDALPAWAEARAPEPAVQDPPVVRGVAFRAVTGGLVAVGLAVLGHTLPAVLLAVVLVVSSTVALTARSVGEAIERGVARLQAAVGRGLTLVLFGLVFGVVFLPASLVLRLLRRDPLELGGGGGGAVSRWRETPRPPIRKTRALERRPYAIERHLGVTASSGRIRAALGLVLVLLVADFGVGSMMFDRSEQEPISFGGPGLTDRPASANQPWIDELSAAFDDQTETLEYDPFLGLRHGDNISSEHLNVTDGVRHSYVADGNGDDEVVVWFFGGSTMLGAYQRDDHTIPSELVRLAEADGIQVRAYNYGRAAYGIWQEKFLLEERLAAGERPDLVVFYDGANEMLMQMELPEASRTPTHFWAKSMAWNLEDRLSQDQEREAGWSSITDAYLDGSAAVELWRRWSGDDTDQPSLGAVRDQTWPNQTANTAQRGETIAGHYSAAVELVTVLSQGYGFETTFFWQPWGPTMDNIAEEDEHIEGWLFTDPEAWQDVAHASREALDPSVVDIADALDGVDEPIMYDIVHTNETGAQIVADAMYEELEPTLRELQEERQA